MKPMFVLSFFAVATVLAQNRPASAGSPDIAVRKADAAWAKAVASKSVEGTAAMYDPEALTAGSAMPPARGLAAVRAMWARIFAQPGFVLTWRIEKVVVTESGTMAYSTGTWHTGQNASGPYIAVWRKQPDGKWKVLVDSAWYSRTPEAVLRLAPPRTRPYPDGPRSLEGLEQGG